MSKKFKYGFLISGTAIAMIAFWFAGQTGWSSSVTEYKTGIDSVAEQKKLERHLHRENFGLLQGRLQFAEAATSEALLYLYPLLSDSVFYWTPKSRMLFRKLRDNATAYGLDSKFYLLDTADQVAAELTYTQAALQFMHDLHFGILDSDSDGTQHRYVAGEFLKMAAQNEFPNNIPEIQPAGLLYTNLQKATARFVSNYAIEDSVFQVPTFKEDSIAAYTLACEILHYRGFLDSTAFSSDSSLDYALKRFQRMHGLIADGKIGKNTSDALEMSNRSRYNRLAWSLEQWRQDSLGHFNPDTFTWVNVPSYLLQEFENGLLNFEMRTVVGSADNQTPELDGEIEYMVAFPTWHVPYSISSKEILPKQQRDSTYLDRNNYKVFERSGKQVDPAVVNWNKYTESNFPFRIKQQGGVYNALGMLKFIFPNEHAIYLHDTNAKRYFAKELRAFSHGCIRVEEPLQYAEILLHADGSDLKAKDVELMIDAQKSKRIDFKKPMPIYIRYRTAGVSAGGEAVFYSDVYDLQTPDFPFSSVIPASGAANLTASR